MSVETLFREINDAGYLVNNLFQSRAFKGDERDWQANIRSPLPDDKCFEFGRGATPEAALKAAFAKVKKPDIARNDMPAFFPKAHVNSEKKAVSVEDFL